MKCKTQKKVQYPSLFFAEQFIISLHTINSDKYEKPSSGVYQCPFCHSWHTTTEYNNMSKRVNHEIKMYWQKKTKNSKPEKIYPSLTQPEIKEALKLLKNNNMNQLFNNEIEGYTRQSTVKYWILGTLILSGMVFIGWVMNTAWGMLEVMMQMV
jgi:hypothetical protein